MVLYVPCFGVISFCTVSPSECLDDIYLSLGKLVVTFWEKAANSVNHMSRVVRKPAFCICENKDADQLRGNRDADQRLCFRYSDSTIPLLPTSESSSL